MNRLGMLRLALVVIATASVLLADAASPWTPALGRGELDGAPAWLGLPILAGFGIAELFARSSRRAPAAIAVTTAFGVQVCVALLRLGAAAFTPEADRDVDTWHLWPLFTALHTVILAGPLYLLAAVLWILDRRRAGRERMTA